MLYQNKLEYKNFKKSRENKISEKGFTLVELIVTITILAILGIIAFVSFQGYSKDARNSARKSDSKSIEKVLSLYIITNGTYPDPTNGEETTYSGSTVWTQGIFGIDTRRQLGTKANLSDTPTDPLTLTEYTYSITNTKTEYQLAVVYEGGETAMLKNDILLNKANAGNDYFTTRLNGTYNGEFLKTRTGGIDYILAVPTIIKGTTDEKDLIKLLQVKKLVYNNSKLLPLSYSGTTIFKEKIPSGEIVNIPYIVVYSGSLNDLRDPNNIQARQTLLENLQKAYSGTLVANEDKISRILSTNTTDITQTENLAISLVNNNLGGAIQNTTLSCATQPSYTHAVFTVGTPTKENQAWQNTDSSAPCYYTCENGYAGYDCSIDKVIFDASLINSPEEKISGYQYLNNGITFSGGYAVHLDENKNVIQYKSLAFNSDMTIVANVIPNTDGSSQASMNILNFYSSIIIGIDNRKFELSKDGYYTYYGSVNDFYVVPGHEYLLITLIDFTNSKLTLRVFDKTNNQVGIFEYTGSKVGEIRENSTYFLLFQDADGNDGNWATNFDANQSFLGKINNVKIFNKILSEAEVDKLK